MFVEACERLHITVWFKKKVMAFACNVDMAGCLLDAHSVIHDRLLALFLYTEEMKSE